MKRILITIACVIFGPFLIWHGLSDLLTASRAKSWPTVPGIVQSTELSTTRGRRGRTTYTPVVKYGYEVNGSSFVGDRVDYGDRGTSSMTDAMAVASRYREGQQLLVRYDPKDPQSAVLEVGTTMDNWLVFGFGLLLSLFGAFSARSLWQSFNSTDYAPASGF
jgi:hypothetical protein